MSTALVGRQGLQQPLGLPVVLGPAAHSMLAWLRCPPCSAMNTFSTTSVDWTPPPREPSKSPAAPASGRRRGHCAEPVRAHRLLAVEVQPARVSRPGTAFVGRQWELNTVAGILDRSISGHGCVVGVAGPAGIGKSRLVGEAAAMARRRGVEVFSTFCESQASGVPFHVVARLFRDGMGIIDLDEGAARGQVRSQFADAGEEDVLLRCDLLGIRDPEVTMPKIDPDARRRRLTALINSASLARPEPAMYIIEDAHWIDEVSESMFTDFMTVIPQTHSTVLITYRPEYRGALAYMPGAQTISLAPLTDSETTALLDGPLGADPSVAAIRDLIARRAAGNPFFAQEMVRELAERRVLEGGRGESAHEHGGGHGAGNAAGSHCRPHRPPRCRCQADAERGGCDRITLHT